VIGLERVVTLAVGVLGLAVVGLLYVLPYWLIATRRGFLPRQLEFPPLRHSESVGSAA